MTGMTGQEKPRETPPAEELIVEIYRQRTVLVEAGRKPARVVMSPAQYERIQEYHRNLGSIAPGKVDYLDRYRLFDLEICVEQVVDPLVEAE